MFLSFICFSKLVIFVNTGQLVENNTSYARDKTKLRDQIIFPCILYTPTISTISLSLEEFWEVDGQLG